MVQSGKLLLPTEARGQAYYDILWRTEKATKGNRSQASVPAVSPSAKEVRVMAKQVKGFLAADGTFFETEAECKRHEYVRWITTSCESHGINPENFFMLLREWQAEIKGYYDADSKCKVKSAEPTGTVAFAEDDVSQSEDDIEDAPVGDKDAPAFLQQSLRRNI